MRSSLSAESCASIKEFAELTRENFPSDKVGHLHIHQEFARRVAMTCPTRPILCIDRTGTGKSVVAIAICHQLARAPYKGSVIITTKGVIDQFKTRIPKLYPEDLLPGKAQINPRLYEFNSHKAFANRLAEMEPKDIEKTYSRHILVFDEIHTITGSYVDEIEEDAKSEEQKQTTLAQFVRLREHAKNCLVIVLTATPMINDAKISIWNLYKVLFGTEPKATTPQIIAEEIVRSASVLYQPIIASAQREDIGDLVLNDITYYSAIMEKRQRQAYDRTNVSRAVSLKLREASFSSALEFDSIEDVSANSALCREVCELEEASFERGEPGTSFAYAGDIAKAGALVLANAFKQYGWTEWKTSTGSRQVPRTYYVYTGDRPGKTEALKIFNSAKNWDGSYIRMIICSRIARDGLDIHHVLRSYMCVMNWNFASSEQATGRTIRKNSFDVLARKLKSGKYTDEAWVDEYIEKETGIIRVHNYNMITLRKKEHKALIASADDAEARQAIVDELCTNTQGVRNVDIYMHMKAISKEIEIRQTARILRRGSLSFHSRREEYERIEPTLYRKIPVLEVSKLDYRSYAIFASWLTPEMPQEDLRYVYGSGLADPSALTKDVRAKDLTPHSSLSQVSCAFENEISRHMNRGDILTQETRAMLWRYQNYWHRINGVWIHNLKTVAAASHVNLIARVGNWRFMQIFDGGIWRRAGSSERNKYMKSATHTNSAYCRLLEMPARVIKKPVSFQRSPKVPEYLVASREKEYDSVEGTFVERERDRGRIANTKELEAAIRFLETLPSRILPAAIKRQINFDDPKKYIDIFRKIGMYLELDYESRIDQAKLTKLIG